MFKFARFNIYLLAAFATLAFTSGCQTTDDKKKVVATLELHLEANGDSSTDNANVPILRDPPVYVNVENDPFLDGNDVDKAEVVNTPAGFAIRIKFNWRGTQILAGETTAHKGKRIGILCGFKQARWLAAPLPHKPILDGVLEFTPDATREEADLIVKGLNNVTAELKKADKL